jgi:hypothetical protein
MATHEILKYHIPKFWDDEFKKLSYINEDFNEIAIIKDRASTLAISFEWTDQSCDHNKACINH